MSRTIVFLLLLSGCAIQPKMTLDELRPHTSRVYNGLTEKEVFNAVEKLFILLDPTDINFSIDGHSVIIKRNWFIYAVLSFNRGTNVFKITVNEEKNVSVVGISIENQMTFGGTLTPMSPVPYEIFWQRLDFLLGRGKEWTPCAKCRKMAANDLDFICLLADDFSPLEYETALRKFRSLP